ncbi:MAG TPA: hypothetical protein VNF68_10365 [Candidatus Baltobacteraceae bacterium]|nr:hypothetical protein [Candidatus Baltobacteraceae bacterium]
MLDAEWRNTVADVARQMLRMLGFGMGLEVEGAQRLNTARAIRRGEAAQALDEDSVEAQASSPAARQRLLVAARRWIPAQKRKR